jgi:uncharacterized flavoprotein (TIGR03862 family)
MKKSIAIIGGGPSAMLFAAFINTDKYSVTLYEQNKALGRKFLVAGKGGFNLTHSEDISTFVQKYQPKDFLKESLLAFDNDALRNWLETIGIETFVGSSKRVYPKEGIKPIEVLQKIEKAILQNKVDIKYQHRFTGWEKDALCFENGNNITPDFTVFALGGGSWSVTGSNATWLKHFDLKGIQTLPYIAMNCAFSVNWKKDFIKQHAGKPLKNIALNFQGKTVKGEVVLTEFGLEGNALYALSFNVQEKLKSETSATVFLDLKPTLTEESILSKLNKDASSKLSTLLKEQLKLNSTQIALVKTVLSKEEFTTSKAVLAHKIKHLAITLLESDSVEKAISTTGGIALNEANKSFELNKLPNTYCIGEMLDWNAPTGGYLLQACFSMGVSLANKLNQ